MKNSILKGALNSFNAKKVATTKDFEVITSLESIFWKFFTSEYKLWKDKYLYSK